MASLAAAVGVWFASSLCAAWASETSARNRTPEAEWQDLTQRATSQHRVAVAQATQLPSTQAANNSALGQQQFAELGQLIDAGGKLVSPEQFKEQIVQLRHVGMLPSGAVIEVMYASSGMIAGSLIVDGTGRAGGRTGSGRTFGAPQNWPVSGSWTIDDSERICASIQIYTSQASSIIPTRCQFWFKLGDKYYVSDSDEDRSAKVLLRELKQ